MNLSENSKGFRTRAKLEISNDLQLRKKSFKEVELTFEFYRIGLIDSIAGKFEASLIIQAKWFDDKNLEENKDIMSYDAEKHWNPKLYIENDLSVTEEMVHSVVQESESLVCVTEYKILEGCKSVFF